MGSPTGGHSSSRSAERLAQCRGQETSKSRNCRLPSRMPTLIVRSVRYACRALARGAAAMTHPIFRKDIFIETAFERRFQAMLRYAWHKRSWHVIVADPGAGKTMGIRELMQNGWLPVRSSRSWLRKTMKRSRRWATNCSRRLGLPLRGHWSTRKPRLMGHCTSMGQSA